MSASEEASVSEMVKCPDCGRDIPAANMMIHRARCSCHRNNNTAVATTTGAQHQHVLPSRSNLYSPVAQPTVEPEPMVLDDDDDDDDDDRKLPAVREPDSTATTCNVESVHANHHNRPPAASTGVAYASAPDVSLDTPPRRRGRHRSRRNIQNHQHDVITIDDSDSDRKPPAGATAARSEVIDLVHDDDDDNNKKKQQEEEDVWACPRCTLRNPRARAACDACMTRRPASERPPDAVRREQLIGGDDSEIEAYYQPSTPSSPGYYMSGGALIGGLMGAAGAYMRGSPVSSGVLEGAMSGVVGGAVLQEVLRDSPVTTRRQQQATSTALQSPQRSARAHSSTSTPEGARVRIRRYGPAGTMTVTTYSSSSGGRHRLHRQRMDDPMLEDMLQAFLSTGGMYHGSGRQSVDNMSYEQLLATFGDGTENRGAQEWDIDALPTATVSNVDSLPADCRQCMVCLEDFSNGDQRKTLPCLHGFHQACIDKWLRTDGACPICKHRIRDR